MMDIIYILLVSQAASHSLGEYTSIIDGIVLISIFMLLNYFLNYLTYHYRFIEKIVSLPSVLVVRDGKPIKKNMRSEFLTMDELMEKLREEGIDDIKDVKHAYVEGDGSISVSTYK